MQFGLKIRSFIERPLLVFFVAMGLLFSNLLVSGSFIRLYKLTRDETVLNSRIVETRKNIAELKVKMEKAKDLDFIMHQAVELYDLAEEDDLVFLFADN